MTNRKCCVFVVPVPFECKSPECTTADKKLRLHKWGWTSSSPARQQKFALWAANACARACMCVCASVCVRSPVQAEWGSIDSCGVQGLRVSDHSISCWPLVPPLSQAGDLTVRPDAQKQGKRRESNSDGFRPLRIHSPDRKEESSDQTGFFQIPKGKKLLKESPAGDTKGWILISTSVFA